MVTLVRIAVILTLQLAQGAEELNAHLIGPPRTMTPACATNADCPTDQYCLKAMGDCDGQGICVPRLADDVQCLAVWDPLCGCNGLSYSNACYAEKAGMNIDRPGACLPGDLDLDNDLDLGDFLLMVNCLQGPGQGIPLPCASADLDGDVDVDLGDLAIFQSCYPEVPQPRVADYSNSGCLPGRTLWPCSGEDSFELSVAGRTLEVMHRNATYNCCPSDIEVSVTWDGGVLHIVEVEILTDPCFCICCYDVQSTIADLPEGTYPVEYCWEDFETGQQQCHVEMIIVPGAPRVATFGDSGCKGTRSMAPCANEDEVELTVSGHAMHLAHRDATYNCCPDDIVITLTVAGDLLQMRETEILTTPCDCMCCYDVDATAEGLASGPWTVEFCWQDYEAGGQRCHVEGIVIP